jgi:hypothetical protein
VLLGAVAAAVLIPAATGFLVARVFFSDSATASDRVPPEGGTLTGILPPGPDVTPEPGSTPDRSRPYWHIPYENQERMAPKFRGELAGLLIGQEPPDAHDEARRCPGAVIETSPNAMRESWFPLTLSGLPDGVQVKATTVATCDDGRPLWIEVDLEIAPGTAGAGAQGGTINVWRAPGVRWWLNEGSTERWSEGEIEGRPVALLDEIVEGIGDAAIIVVDEETGGSTRVWGSGASLALLQQVAEAMYE